MNFIHIIGIIYQYQLMNKQIKEFHPIFYQFLIEKKLLGIYLEIFDKSFLKK